MNDIGLLFFDIHHCSLRIEQGKHLTMQFMKNGGKGSNMVQMTKVMNIIGFHGK